MFWVDWFYLGYEKTNANGKKTNFFSDLVLDNFAVCFFNCRDPVLIPLPCNGMDLGLAQAIQPTGSSDLYHPIRCRRLFFFTARVFLQQQRGNPGHDIMKYWLIFFRDPSINGWWKIPKSKNGEVSYPPYIQHITRVNWSLLTWIGQIINWTASISRFWEGNETSRDDRGDT